MYSARGSSRSARPPSLPPANRDEDELDEEARSELERLFDEGMECWWAGDHRAACRLFRRVLEREPAHTEALNHLGLECLERGRCKDAERHFRAAVAAGLGAVEREGGLIKWSRLENRPYLRALANLALALSRQGRWVETVELWEQLLRFNPNDNLGIRYLIGGGYRRLGRLEEAVQACEAGVDDPACFFDLALALLAGGRPQESARALRRGLVGNPYIAPMLLGVPWDRLPGSGGSSKDGPEQARDYVRGQGDLWRATKGSAELLRAVTSSLTEGASP